MVSNMVLDSFYKNPHEILVFRDQIKMYNKKKKGVII